MQMKSHERALAWSWRALLGAGFAFCGWIALAPAADEPTPALRPGERVRVQIDGDARWIDGQLVVAPLGCTQVRLAAGVAPPDGRSAVPLPDSVPLASLQALTRDHAGRWQPVEIAALRAAEPPRCTA